MRQSRLHIAGLTLLVAIAAISCQRKKKRPGKSERPVRVLPIADVPMPVFTDELTSPGATPREKLRYKPGRASSTLQIQAVAELRETIDGSKKPTLRLPAVTTGFDVSRPPNGQSIAVVAVAAQFSETDDPAALATSKQLAVRYKTILVGKDASLAIDDRGLLGGKPLKAQGGGEAKTRALEYVAALADLIVPLPSRAVGIGAKWRIVRAVPRAGTRVKQTIEYELIERRGDLVTIGVSGQILGERQGLDAPNLPKGALAELLALRVELSGRLVIDLNHPIARSGNLVRRDTVHTRAAIGGRTISDYYSESTSTLSLSTR